MSRFTGKVAIITGSSNGIGRSTAILFAQEGASVVIHGRSEEALQETFNQVAAAGGAPDRVLKVLGDLTKEETQQKIVDETVKKFGKIDILVNNAGGLCPDNTGTLGFEQNTEAFDYAINLNVRAILNLTKAAVPHLAKTKGEIINISSIAAKPWAAPGYPYYSVAKAALDQLTISMAGTFIKQGIRVNGINPGAIHTTFVRKQGVTEEAQAAIEEKFSKPHFIPLGRVGEAREIAETIAFLADRSRSEFIVGSLITVDGGTSLLNPTMQGFSSLE